MICMMSSFGLDVSVADWRGVMVCIGRELVERTATLLLAGDLEGEYATEWQMVSGEERSGFRDWLQCVSDTEE